MRRCYIEAYKVCLEFRPIVQAGLNTILGATMRIIRRDFVKLAALSIPGFAAWASLASAADGTKRAAKPLRILILGGTGFTGPHQVRYALVRGHGLRFSIGDGSPMRGRAMSNNWWVTAMPAT